MLIYLTKFQYFIIIFLNKGICRNRIQKYTFISNGQNKKNRPSKYKYIFVVKNTTYRHSAVGSSHNPVSLIIDYPWFLIPLCLLLGVAYGALLYWVHRRRETNAEASLSKRLTTALFLLRTLSVAMIAFLLLSPLVKRDSSHKEKPIVIMARDNSKSLDYSSDSAFYHGDFLLEVEALAKELSKVYDVKYYTFGSSVSAVDGTADHLFDEPLTDMARLFSDMSDRYYHRNVGAMIVMGDGIYNSGSSPLGAATDMAIPIYTVAMGDTAVQRDASVANVRYNRIAYLGNSFPMEVTVNAAMMQGETAVMTVSCDGKKLYAKQIHYDAKRFSTVENVTLDADRAGLHNYVVEITVLDGERSVRNNRRIVPIEIIDGHRKIAIIAAVPHPDMAALRNAIEKNQNFEVETFLARDFNKNPLDYNLLILHQLPSSVAEAGIDVEGLLASGTPALFILGSQTSLPRLNALHAGLEVFSRIEQQNDVAPLYNRDFTFFTMDDDIVSNIERFPPLVSPFGEYKLSGNAQTLFTSRVGSVNSGMPLVAVTQQQERRYSFIAGEGLWRWRMADYQTNSSHDHFDAFIDKLVVFTALRLTKDRFHVTVKNVFSQSEPVVIEAQLFNDNYEAVNTADVEVTIARRDGASAEQKRYLFNRAGTGYQLNLGAMEAGMYGYNASTTFNGKKYSSVGSFIVEDLQMEAMNLVADHSLMATLAASTGAAMVDAHHVDQLEALLKQRDDIKTVIYSETSYSDMLNMPLIFILIVLLLAAEWVIRKYNGEI